MFQFSLGMLYDSDKKGLSASRRPFEVLEQAQNFRSQFKFCLSKFCRNPGVHQRRGLAPSFVVFKSEWGFKGERGKSKSSLPFVVFAHFSAGTNYGELKLVSILIRDAVLLGPRMNYPHPGGRAWGRNWMTVFMGEITLFIGK